jgi:hypothetical protein
MVVIHRVKPVGRLLPEDGSFVAFIAEQDEKMVGLACSTDWSGPPASGRFPLCRPDVIELVEDQGFVREAEDGLYRWERNEAA